MVLNNPPAKQGKGHGGFCYRCVFPKPPPAESVLSCGEGGILGPVVGLMGVLMAVEAVKIIVASVESTDDAATKTDPSSQTAPSLLLYSAYGNPPFRSIRLRGKRAQCPACSDTATITRKSLTSGSLDYAKFCGLTIPSEVLDENYRISAKEYSRVREHKSKEHLLIDVRERVQYDLCHIKGSINIPFSDVISTAEGSDRNQGHTALLKAMEHHGEHNGEPLLETPMYCICRLGNDSQLAVKEIQKWGFADVLKGDIKGGLHAWRKEVDPTFPEY